MFKHAEIISRKTDSGVSDQPKSLEETVRGAINRAKSAFQDCKYSFGIESGLMAVPHTKTGYMDMAICAIYDGSQIHLGMSSAFECPIEITRLVFEEGLDLNQASQRIGITTDPKIGDSQGLVGVISKGHIMRRDYTIQAIKTALIHLQNPELYNPIQ
jgi:inosine/xanthosine triphosphatase